MYIYIHIYTHTCYIYIYMVRCDASDMTQKLNISDVALSHFGAP